MSRSLQYTVYLVLACSLVHAQTPAPAAQVPGLVPGGTVQQPPDLGGQLAQLRPSYVLHPGDQILIRAAEVDEITERPYRIDGDGFIDLPLLGRVQAGGIAVEKLEANLVELLKKYVKAPVVTITVVQFSSEPVFFVGSFKAPGMYALSGGRTLVEMMTSVGGVLPSASRRIKVVRRKEYGAIPLPNAVTLPDGSSSVEISVAALQNNLNPAEDIVLQPFDVITAERAQLIYVMGEVGKVGTIEVDERGSMSVMQVLIMSGGLTPTANPKSALILRPVMDTARRAVIPVDLPHILKGEGVDRPLLPNDIFVIGKRAKLSPKDILLTATGVIGIAVTLVRIGSL